MSKLHTVSFDRLKNPGEELQLPQKDFFCSSECGGIAAVAAVGGIDMLQLALSIFYKKVIRH